MKMIFVLLLSFVNGKVALADTAPSTIQPPAAMIQCQEAQTSHQVGVFAGEKAASMMQFMTAHQQADPFTFYVKFVDVPNDAECITEFYMTTETWNCDASRGACAVSCEVKHIRDVGDCWP